MIEVYNYDNEKMIYEEASEWIILSKNSKILNNITKFNSQAKEIKESPSNNFLWTDNYNNALYLIFKNLFYKI
jgi:hypothetical protein